MKNTIFIASVLTFLITSSCNKTTEGNKSIITEESTVSTSNEQVAKPDIPVLTTQNENEVKSGEYTERYVAEDGSSALVTFKNSDKENTISIRSNNKTIAAPRKAASGPGVYGNFDFEIVSKNDSVIITQGNNIITLKKARGQ